MASFSCFVTYVKQAAANSNFGLLSHGELIRILQGNGMTRQEIDEAIGAMNELYHARIRQVQQRSLSKNQRRMVNIVYGGGLGGMNVNQTQMIEDIAHVLGVPMITSAEMTNLRALAQQADQREGSEKALVEEKIRDVLAQKQSDYLAKLNSAKISFKVLLSAGFTVMSYVSNQKKIFEQYFTQRLRMQKQGKSFFAPYALRDYDKFAKSYANAMARGVRGVTEEQGFWQRFKAWMGLTSQSLLGPTAAIGSDISSHSDALEHVNDREANGLLGKWRALDRRIARTSKRWLSSIDTSAKIRMGEVFYFNERYKDFKNQFPQESEAQTLRRVYTDMYAIPEPDAIREAEQQFQNWGIVDSKGQVNKNSNRFQVRVAEIMREGRDPDVMARAFQTSASKVWQGRMTYPSMANDPYDLTKFQQRLDSGLGGIISDLLNGARRTVDAAVGNSAVGKNFVFSLFGFINGAAAYWQDYMEHNAIYGGAKYARLHWMLYKDNQNRRLTDEQRSYLQDKIVETKGKVMFSLIETAMLAAVGVLAHQLCGDKSGTGKTGGALTDFISPDKPVGDQAVLGNVEMQRPESAINICGGVSIPLEYTGGFSVSNVKLIANMMDQLENKNETFISAAIHAIWLTANPNITPLMDNNPSAVSRIWTAYEEAAKSGKGYDALYAIAERELAMAASNMIVRQLPIPNRLVKESELLAIPYRTYLPAGLDPNPKENLLNFFYQTGLQTVYGTGNATGVNQLIQLSTTQDGLIGKPVFDYRHRPIDMGNMYDGKSVAGLTKPLRNLVEDAKGKQPILYDEKDHFFAVNEVNIPWDSRIYTVLYKNDPAKKRLLSDDEYYNYTYAYSKAFGEWVDRNFSNLKNLPPKDVRTYVTREITALKKAAIAGIESKNNVDPDMLYHRIR